MSFKKKGFMQINHASDSNDTDEVGSYYEKTKKDLQKKNIKNEVERLKTCLTVIIFIFILFIGIISFIGYYSFNHFNQKLKIYDLNDVNSKLIKRTNSLDNSVTNNNQYSQFSSAGTGSTSSSSSTSSNAEKSVISGYENLSSRIQCILSSTKNDDRTLYEKMVRDLFRGKRNLITSDSIDLLSRYMNTCPINCDSTCQGSNGLTVYEPIAILWNSPPRDNQIPKGFSKIPLNYISKTNDENVKIINNAIQLKAGTYEVEGEFTCHRCYGFGVQLRYNGKVIYGSFTWSHNTAAESTSFIPRQSIVVTDITSVEMWVYLEKQGWGEHRAHDNPAAHWQLKYVSAVSVKKLK